MELLSSDLEAKAEKVTPMLAYFNYSRRLHFRTAFRVAESLTALLVFLWMFNRLPAAVQISGEFLRRLVAVIVSPLFVFLFCNAIIVTLMVKSGRLATANNADVEEDLYEVLLNNTDGRCPKPLPESRLTTLSSAAAAEEEEEQKEEEVLFQDKEIVVVSQQQVNAIAPATACQADEANSKDEIDFYSSDSESESEVENQKVFRRTRSENLQRKRGDKKKKLQRSETEKSRKMAKSDEGGGIEEEELSDEEFQRAVEEFIAKNLRFRREETKAVVVQGRCSVAQLELKNGIVTN